MARYIDCPICGNDCFDHNTPGSFLYYSLCALCSADVGELQSPGWDASFRSNFDKRQGQRYRINDLNAVSRIQKLIDIRNAKTKTTKCFLCENICYRRFNFRFNTCAKCTALVMKNTNVIKNKIQYHKRINPKDGYSYKASIWKEALINLKKKYDSRNNKCACVPWYCICKEMWTLPV